MQHGGEHLGRLLSISLKTQVELILNDLQLFERKSVHLGEDFVHAHRRL